MSIETEGQEEREGGGCTEKVRGRGGGEEELNVGTRTPVVRHFSGLMSEEGISLECLS